VQSLIKALDDLEVGMSAQMEIAFCADRKMLAALHVAAKSALEHFNGEPSFTVLSDDLGDAEMALLHKTLATIGKKFQLNLLHVDSKTFQDFPSLAGRYSTYFRLLIPDLIPNDRCLYLDCDILCYTDVSHLGKWDLRGLAVGLAPEAPIHQSLDKKLFVDLGPDAHGSYYNAGVCLIDSAKWRNENLAHKCFDYIAKNRPDFHDQSALNYCFHGEIAPLPLKFNFHTNVRANWPLLRKPKCGEGCLLHFVDYPKPWSALGRWVHPFGSQWWGEYRKTAHFQKNRHKPSPMRRDAKTRLGYRKAFKDKILFSLYNRGLFLPKGVPAG
jgi:lipopolysaccharide biosynthesis glycosyltransferase